MRAAGIALLVGAIVYAGGASAQTIGGRYNVDGTNPDGSHYGGTAEIIPLRGRTCRITWQTGSTWNGVCLIGERSFGATYRSGSSSGMAVYDLLPDGVLRGVWALGDSPRSGTETLIPAR